jgi:hypothetical protein
MAFAETEQGLGGPEVTYWHITHDVYPNLRLISTDVMLIQGMLVGIFLHPALSGPQVSVARTIITSGGSRFDDGIYGPKTRKVVRLFEEIINHPHKDGIFRGHTSALSNTKMGRLNFYWDMSCVGGPLGATKFQTAAALQPTVARELYPAWPDGESDE